MPDPFVQIGCDVMGVIDDVGKFIERCLGQLGKRLLAGREQPMMYRKRIVHVAKVALLVVHVLLHDGHRLSVQTVEWRHPGGQERRERQCFLLLRRLCHLKRSDYIHFTGQEVKGIDGQVELVTNSGSAKTSGRLYGSASLLNYLIVAKTMLDDPHDMTDVGDALRYYSGFLWMMSGLEKSKEAYCAARDNERDHCPEADCRWESGQNFGQHLMILARVHSRQVPDMNLMQ